MLRKSRRTLGVAISGVLYQSALLSSIVLFSSAVIPAEGVLPDSFERTLSRAHALYAKKQYQEARKEYEQALQLDRGSLSAWRNLGWSHWALGQKELAYKIWADLLKAFPEDVPTLLALGEANEQDHRWNAASDYYAKVLNYEPENHTVNRGMARIYIAQQKFKAAEQASRTILKKEPNEPGAVSLLADALIGQGRFGEAETPLQSLTKQNPASSNIRRLANVLTEQGKNSEALALYSKLVKQDSSNTSAYLDRAKLLLAQQQFAAAEQDAKAAVKLSPSDENAKLVLADALMGQHKNKEAIAVLKKLVKSSPIPTHTHRLAKALVEEGEYEDAATLFKTSVAHDNVDYVISGWRGLGHHLRKLGQKQRAYDIWQDLLKRYPNDTQTLLALGNAYEQDGAYQQGLDLYDDILRSSPNNQYAHLGKARLFGAQKNYPAAESELHAALDSAPTDAKAHAAMAEILIEMHRYAEAEAILQPLVNTHPTPENMQLLGMAMAKQGRPEEAEPYFRKSMDTGSANAKSMLELANIFWIQHRYAPAMTMLETYLETHPDNDVVRSRLIDHAAAAGLWEKAQRELRYLVQKHPGETKWEVKLAQQYQNSGRFKEAVPLAKAVFAKDPTNSAALQLLSNNAIFSNDIDEGIIWTTRLAKVKLSFEAFNQLAKLNIEQGSRLEKHGKLSAAMQAYAEANENYKNASLIDPIKSRAPIGQLDALRLLKRYPEALQLVKQLQRDFPGSLDVNLQLSQIYSEMGNAEEAHRWLEKARPYIPSATQFQKRTAKLDFYSGHKDQALQSFSQLVDLPDNTDSIPVLLYHGITVSEREDTMPLNKFRDQMLALKSAGYQTIDLQQFLKFLDGELTLPEKSILLTFDDARTDTFKYADPILAEVGFKGVMFVPVADVGTSGQYSAVWPSIKQLAASGRWDMQCHGTLAHRYVPVNDKGYMGRFMANRKWLSELNRLETEHEFKARLEDDLLSCRTALSKQLPQSTQISFAYPFSDQGHKSLSNHVGAFAQNQEIVKMHFKLGFHVDNDYLVTRNSPRYQLPRYEVPRTFSGDDLVSQLKTLQPKLLALRELAELKKQASEYADAMPLFEELKRQGVFESEDKKAYFYFTTGKMSRWSGDHADARARYEQALKYHPNDPEIKQEVAILDGRLGPRVSLNGEYFEDNARRSYYGLGPTLDYTVSDKLTLSAFYKYFDFKQVLDSSILGPNNPEQIYQTDVNQFGLGFNYELGARSMLTLSAGAADYSGNAYSNPAKLGSIFPLGFLKYSHAIGDKLDLSFALEHTYVKTAGGILNDIAFSRAQLGGKAKLTETIDFTLNHAYYYYTDQNRRNRTEAQLTKLVWSNPALFDVSAGAQFIYDDALNRDTLFWTPNHYVGFNVPLSLKKQWGDQVETQVSVAPGTGREVGSEFRFQLNAIGSVNWKVNDEFTMYLNAGRYEAATYSSFNAAAGFSIKF